MKHYEIERKFLIRRPTESFLCERAEKSEIVQTYLLAEAGKTERVRRRGSAVRTQYTHTVKTRISAMRRVEEESPVV